MLQFKYCEFLTPYYSQWLVKTSKGLLKFLFTVSVASPMVPGMRNILENKVSGQMSSNSANHNARQCSNEEYMNIVQRLGNEVSRCTTYLVHFPKSFFSPSHYAFLNNPPQGLIVGKIVFVKLLARLHLQ